MLPRRHSWPMLLALASSPLPLPAQVQPTHRLGVFFWHDSPNDMATWAGIQQGLRQAGIVGDFMLHRADSDPERAQSALLALRQARCDLVFAMGTQAALLAKTELTDVPVLFAAVSDAVASGVVNDWRGSGSNLCGASNWIAPGNVLDVFQLAVPDLKRLGMLRSTTSGVVSAAEFATMRAWLAEPSAPALLLSEAVATDAAGIEGATRQLVAAGVDAIWIPIDITIYQNVPLVQKGLGSARLPLLTTAAAGVRSGAMVGAVVDYGLHGRRAAALALDVLVHGKPPGSLPIDRMHGTLVTVNLAAARAAGIQLPLSLLALADDLLDVDAEVPDGRGKR